MLVVDKLSIPTGQATVTAIDVLFKAYYCFNVEFPSAMSQFWGVSRLRSVWGIVKEGCQPHVWTLALQSRVWFWLQTNPLITRSFNYWGVEATLVGVSNKKLCYQLGSHVKSVAILILFTTFYFITSVLVSLFIQLVANQYA